MHQNFWKYLAAISIFTCIFVVVAWLFWPHSSFSELKKMKNEVQVNHPVAEETVPPEPQKQEITPNPKLTIFAAGDIMLDRTMLLLAQKYNDYGFTFGLISSTLRTADLRVANLEGPITTNKSVSNGTGGNRFFFTFSPKVVEPLHRNFDIVSLANNHTTNFGFEGLAQTRSFLDKGDVLHFGDPTNQVGNISIIVEKNGIKIGFIGYHQLVETGFENVLAEVRRIRPNVDVIIAYPHWGIEYVTNTPSIMQKKDAQALIDAGVDIIVGAHPHVIEPIEVYKNRIIFYSLGNFIFDQYFSLETMQGLTLKMILEKNNGMIDTQIQLIPIHISKESQPFLATDDERRGVLSSLARVSIVDEGLKQDIRTGKLHITIPLTETK